MQESTKIGNILTVRSRLLELPHMPQEYIGITSLPREAPVKQAALLFDKVLVKVDSGARWNYREILASMDATTTSFDKLVPPMPWLEPIPEVIANLDDLRRYVSDSAAKTMDEASRRWAAKVRIAAPDSVVLPLLTSPNLSAWRASTKDSILRLVLHELPMPDDTTPWEAIADWRSDAEARRQYRRLRNWISGMARSAWSEADVYDTLATLLDDYTTYVLIHHKHLRRGRLEVISTITAGLLEDLAHMRPSSAMERLFALSRDELTLLETELNAPGREIAYIASARERFGK